MQHAWTTLMTLDLEHTRLRPKFSWTRIYVLSAFSAVILSTGCGVNKHLRDCSITDKQVEKMLITQIDSVYKADTTLVCTRFKKIVSCKLSGDSLMRENTKLIIKAENRCETWEYFYFNADLKIIKVSHELQPVY
jgi:hypothetical protein